MAAKRTPAAAVVSDPAAMTMWAMKDEQITPWGVLRPSQVGGDEIRATEFA
jgi:hypothetical protein